jgi:hypothetical protein
MEFDSEDDAWTYWQEEIYYGQGEGYVGLGRNFDQQVDLFKEWLEEECITWQN